MPGKQQKSIAIVEVGKPAVALQRSVVPPSQGEVLVKVEVAHLLPHDSYMRDWGLFVKDKLPWVLAGDLVGTIEEIGPSTPTNLQKGDRVLGLGTWHTTEPVSAGTQEYSMMPVDSIAKVPDSFKSEDAATVPLNLVTTFIALYTEKMGLNWPAPWTAESKTYDFASKTLILIGGGSNCAKFAIQLAKISGVGRIIAIAGLANEKELKDMGATHVVDRHGSNDEIKAQIHSIVPKDEVTYVYDTYSWTYELAVSLISNTKPSRLVILHHVDLTEIQKQHPKLHVAPVACSNQALGPHVDEFWKHLPAWLEKKQILPATWKIVGNLDAVDEVNRVLDDYRDGKGGPQALVVP